jgi:hypothetical protein
MGAGLISIPPSSGEPQPATGRKIIKAITSNSFFFIPILSGPGHLKYITHFPNGGYGDGATTDSTFELAFALTF